MLHFAERADVVHAREEGYLLGEKDGFFRGLMYGFVIAIGALLTAMGIFPHLWR